MGGNTGRGIGGGGGAGINSTPPSSASGGNEYGATQYGVVVADSAYNQARVTFTDGNDGKITTAKVDEMIRHSGIPSDFGGSIDVIKRRDGSVYLDVNGQGVTMQRVISKDDNGKTFVYNQYFRIDEGTKYDGRGFEIFNNQITYLSNNKSIYGDKVSYVKVSAAGNGPAFGASSFNGYYTWVRFGYKVDQPYNANFTNAFNQATGANARDMWEMMSSKAGRDWWKENGRGWQGTFDLSKGSASRAILSDYVKERAKSRGR